MAQRVVVHQRVSQRHPEIEDTDVIVAWNNCLCSACREQSAFNDYVALGFDGKGRLMEMIAVLRTDGSWFIYHAFTPPTKRILKELGFADEGRRNERESGHGDNQ